MIKNLAIIGASYLQLPLIEKAKDMGLETHVFAWAANDVGEKSADYFYPISIIEKEQILEKCKEIGIDGICSIASDLASLTVNYVANNLGLTGNSIESSHLSTNKCLMRKAFEKNSDPSPRSITIDSSFDFNELDLKYPIIVKPTDRSGSRSIYKLETSEGLQEAINDAISSSFEKKAVIEEYIEGKEYSVEYISWKGKHYFITITEKFTTGAPHFIETGHKEPGIVNDELLNKVKDVVSHALDSLKVENGASHSEIKIDDNNNIKIVEIGGRMGGDLIGSHLVPISTGYDFVKAVIDVSMGVEPEKPSGKSIKNVKVDFVLDEETTDSSNRKGYKITEM